MNKSQWSKQVVLVEGYPVTTYTNSSSTRTICFYLYGRYSSYLSDTNSLTLAISMLFYKYSDHSGGTNNTITIESYKASLEDTAVIHIDNIEQAS